MNKAIVSISGLSLITLGVAALQKEPEPVRIYDQDNIHTAGLGACEISSVEAHCWNMDGAADAGLTKRITTALTSSNQEISFRFGQKNIFLVIDSSGNQPNLSRKPQGYLNTVYLNQAGNSRLLLGRINPDEEHGPIVLNGTIGGLPGPAPVDLPSTPESSARVGGTTYTVGTYRVKNNPPNGARNDFQSYNYNPYGIRASKEWVVAIGTSDPNNTEGFPAFSALDKDKKPIMYVDRNGMPITSLKFIESENVNPSRPGFLPNGNPDPKAKVIPAYVQQSQTSIPGAFTMDTDIDPKYIAAYRITLTGTAKFNLGPFPIEPK